LSDQYHLGELKVARDPSHPGHILPPPLPDSKIVLDVGCGAGQTLIAAYPNHVCFGLDIDHEALRLGKTLTDQVHFVRGQAEALPWPDAHFDALISRVALVYTNIDRSLSEFRRVLKDGGQLWMTLHPFSMLWQEVNFTNYKSLVRFGYVTANSTLFHFTQRQFPLRGKYESFQTKSGMLRALKKTGFEVTSISLGKHFVVTAKAR
jgi:ubiquinone/menaquinone biosynthesis C-methylase UbiE